MVADSGDRVGDGHAGQPRAVRERIVADGGDGVGNCHAGQSRAVKERPFADGGDGIGRAVVGDRFGNHDIAGVDSGRITCPIVGDGGFVAVDVVEDAASLKVVGHGGGWQQQCQQQEQCAGNRFHKRNDFMLMYCSIQFFNLAANIAKNQKQNNTKNKKRRQERLQ